MFNSEKKCYDMVYTTSSYMARITFVKIGDKLVGTLNDKNTEKWMFSEITENTFHWQNVTVLENGEYRVNCNIYGKRKNNQ